MYKYELVNNDEFKIAYKKYIRKSILKVGLIISIVNLIMLSLLFLALVIIYEAEMKVFISISSILLIIEGIIFYYSYKKDIKKLLNNKANKKANISLDEKGILIYEEGISRQINWQAVEQVEVDEDNLIFQYKASGIPGNFFYLKFFDVEKDELIKDIKNYIKVKGC